MRIFSAIFLFAFSFSTIAADWAEVSRISENVRQIDKDSIRKTGDVIRFVSRHVIADPGEFQVGRNSVKYLVMEQQVDCRNKIITLLVSEALRADESSIERHVQAQPSGDPVLPGSVDDDIYRYLCNPRS